MDLADYQLCVTVLWRTPWNFFGLSVRCSTLKGGFCGVSLANYLLFTVVFLEGRRISFTGYQFCAVVFLETSDKFL